VRRRNFLIALGAAFWTIARSSSALENRLPRIGLLTRMLPNRSLIDGFHQGLRELGYVEGTNILVEWRNASADDELPALAAELVRMKVDVIVTSSTPAARAAVEATKSIPIVFTATGDPVATGLVASLARPGHNATGVSIMTTELVSKRLDFLHQLAPQARRVVFLANFGNPSTQAARASLHASAQSLGIKLEPLDVRRPQQLADALRSAAWKSADAALISGELSHLGHGAMIAQAVRAARKPAIFPWREYHEYGVVMSYGPVLKDVLGRGAYYVDKILKGANPSELPVEQISKFDLVIDLRAARSMGIVVPKTLLYRADEVIR
jgi:putative ABC transport system substrate-binding protein